MAVLAELFLVLAGFDTGLKADQLQHPAELDVFERARRFGKRFCILRDTCARRKDTIAKTVETLVVQKYLEDLADIESQILDELSTKDELPLGNGLLKSAEIMSRSVDQWQRRFELSLRLLSELDPKSISVAQSIEEVNGAARLYAGYNDVTELCDKCTEALDIQWLGDLKVSLTTFGVEDYYADDLVAHPSLIGTHGATLVSNAIVSVRQLGSRHARGDQGLVLNFLDVADQNSRLIDSVETPITARQLITVLERVHFNILGLVRARILHTQNVDAMLTFLRDILLFGSSVFVDEFCNARGDAGLALDMLCDHDPVFAADVYAFVDPMLQFHSDSAELSVSWPLSLLFTADQCIVYCSIHSTFASIIVTLNAIKPGQGAAMHTYQLFLAMLWSEFQNAVDIAFSELREAIRVDQDLSVQSTQSRILRDLVRKMFLDLPSIRAQLQLVIEHVEVQSSSVKPVRDLATSLSQLPHGSTMPLRPFMETRVV